MGGFPWGLLGYSQHAHLPVIQIAELGGDILDISQTLVGDYFTMIIVVDTASLGVPFADFKASLEAVRRTVIISALRTTASAASNVGRAARIASASPGCLTVAR